jgi:iron-sulfur cluster assembly protein
MITLTETAQARMVSILTSNNENTILFGTNSKGCGGNGYVIGIIDRTEVEPNDEMIKLDEDDLVLVVDQRSALLLFGTVIDWQETATSGSFVFSNPNAAGSCGCGASFTTGSSCSD